MKLKYIIHTINQDWSSVGKVHLMSGEYLSDKLWLLENFKYSY